ncbi:cytochrome c oxidase subunit II [Rhizobium leguminosarum]|uniref:cytochrome c oxidase subunit II n=1 Tax=Rhizobium leguminosarum TaxID=384 RepID=UPI001C921EB6|nr:cytochrome c oxidase subunit II [Rhizobium leguminosarum]MBY3001961.1 cytochrome c oxidase subunit II [Rhizobium leguminosarum]
MTRSSIIGPSLASLCLSGCTGSQSALDAAGASASALKQLIVVIVVVCAVVWLLVMLVLAWSLLRSRDGRGVAGNDQKARKVVAGAVAATAFIIAGLTIISFYTTRKIGEASETALTVTVRGQQWWWQFIYPDDGSGRDFKTANELHIPVGQAVKLRLESADVIHSFWVPSLAGKLDLIPGRINELTLHADRPGIYRGQCAEYCGLQHSHMAVLVIAEDEVSYRQWVQGQQRERLPPADPQVTAGETVFMSKPCAACHTIRGTSAAGVTGPDLTHVGSRQTIAAGLLPNTRGSLAAWIADPQTLKPGNNMPLVPLSGEELKQVSAYLESLK